MGWTVTTEQYQREITDDETGEKAAVTFRCLNTGDRVEISSKATEFVVEEGEGGEAEGSGRVDMGRFQFLAIQRAVVKWDLPFPCTEATLKQLRSEVFSQIWGFVSFDSIPPTVEEETPLDESVAEPKLDDGGEG